MFWCNPWSCSTTDQIEAVIAYRVRRAKDGDKYFDNIEIDVVQDLEEFNEDQRKG